MFVQLVMELLFPCSRQKYCSLTLYNHFHGILTMALSSENLFLSHVNFKGKQQPEHGCCLNSVSISIKLSLYTLIHAKVQSSGLFFIAERTVVIIY